MDHMTQVNAGHADAASEIGPYLKLRIPEAEPAAPRDDLPGTATFPDAQERLAHIVRTIEVDIIPRLLRAHPHEVPPMLQRASIKQPEAGAVAAFAALVLAVDDVAWSEAMEAHLARGVCIDTLCMELLAPTARELGRLWDEDRISFPEVTVGVGRLQRALRTLASGFEEAPCASFDGRRILLMLLPGDNHTFGISVVEEFFRRAGWEVVGHSDPRCDDPVSLVAEEWFDVVGVSAGDGTRLELLPDLIASLRGASRNSSLAVLLGGPALQPDGSPTDRFGADGVASDARLAPALAEKMLETRSGRLVAASS